ncbi:predicted protein [Streptomyces iranensis]|uniref:Uncharacterized protein n=1 Tax=Streptomyces iranensis TaxID=576784 RepID=A0A060ZML8_9ACTN|nr:predicted protein [Streptomyces iranensis]
MSKENSNASQQKGSREYDSVMWNE